MTRRLLLCLLLIFLLSGGNKSIGAEEWAETPVNLTVREFLDMHFSNKMGRVESDALNSFNLVSFYPSGNPQTAFVFIIQTWRDSRIPERDLRREIRKFGDACYDQFKAMTGHPTVRKRWKIKIPKDNFVIKHVRYTDLKEVLAVTTDGTTYFDEEAIGRAASMVKLRGGVWAF
jgi:hypothetical protein